MRYAILDNKNICGKIKTIKSTMYHWDQCLIYNLNQPRICKMEM